MRRIALSLATFFIALPALAQSDVEDRLSRIERDLTFVQKQVYSGGAGATGGAGGGATEVRLSEISEEIRQLRGLVEQAQYDNQKNAQDLKKYMADSDYRLQALEQKAAAAAVAPVAEVPPAAPAEPAAPATYQKKDEAAAAASAETTAPTGKDFPNSNAHYSYAFKLLNEKNYSAAAASFDQFVKKYPSDPLTSNAYYWLGESYYARGDFTRAAEGFRKGFEANTDGQKAPDNLLKLAMSLGKVKRVNEACIVLKQVKAKYGESAPRTANRAAEESASLQCK